MLKIVKRKYFKLLLCPYDIVIMKKKQNISKDEQSVWHSNNEKENEDISKSSPYEVVIIKKRN